jgi:hypothetical protein
MDVQVPESAQALYSVDWFGAMNGDAGSDASCSVLLCAPLSPLPLIS